MLRKLRDHLTPPVTVARTAINGSSAADPAAPPAAAGSNSLERPQNAAAPQSAEVDYLTPADAPPCAREAGLTRSEIEQFQSDGERTRAFELAHFVTLAMPTMMLCHRVIAT